MATPSQFARFRHLLHEAVWVRLRPYWRLHIAIAAGVVALVAFETCFPLTIKYLIDDALIPQDRDSFVIAMLLLVLLFAIAWASRFALTVVRAHLARELYWDLSTDTFGLLQRLPLSFFDRLPPAHFSPLFDTELLTFSKLLRDLLEKGLQSALQLVVILVTMFVLNWQLASLVALLLPLFLLQPQRRLAATLGAIDRIRKVVEQVNGIVQDHVSTQPLLRAFGLARRASLQFEHEVAARKGGRNRLRNLADWRRTLKIPHFVMQSFDLSMANAQAAVTLIVIGTGALLSFAGLLSLGSFSAFILLLPVVMKAISNLAAFVQDLGRATLSLDRLEAVSGAVEPELETSAVTNAPQQQIAFRQLDFSYLKDAPGLREINLTLPIGQSVAFVGRSGAGKSTLFKLLLGFYQPSCGQIMIDGRDIREIDPESLGAQFGTVLQQSLLVNASVRSNICFARPLATDEEVEQAARLAGIHDFIMALPDAYSSPVGEGGKWFSEGQRQRIALARAILTRAQILLLDEVTSALDPETETAINVTIRQLAMDRTVMLVTHRLASARFVDHIVVMDQGQVKEQGSHEELLALEGLYHQLWHMQAGFVVSGDGHHAQVSGERLGSIPLFRGVDIATLDRLAERFVSMSYQPGQTIYAQGDAGEKFYILVRGNVAISTSDAGQQAIRLADLQDGDYFGEVEMVNKGRRTTLVRARTPTLVLALQADHFHNMMRQLDSLGKVVTQMALGRSLSTICSIGRRRRSHPVWQELLQLSG